MNRRSYSLVALAAVNIETLVAGHAGRPRFVGVDVGKERLVVCLMWPDESFERPWKVRSPREIPLLVEKLKQLQIGGGVILAMESSGTYGDVLRQAAQDAGIEVHRVSAKAVKDSAESFDGVPSQHDGKDSAVIADLCRRGRSEGWALSMKEGADGELRYWLRRWEAVKALDQVWAGKLEALLARHWPEAAEVIESSSATLLAALRHWGEPRALACDAGAGQRLASFGGPLLKEQKIAALVESARATQGVRMTTWEVREMKDVAGQRLELESQARMCRRQLQRLAEDNAQIKAQREAVGLVAACVLWVCLGPVERYPCAAAYRKAMGLNLTEYSSGKYKGPLHISRRGNSLIRKTLYFAAMRAMQEHGHVKAWVEKKKARDGGHGGRAVVAVMRKLALAVWHMARNGEAFDAGRLFPGKRRGRQGSTVTAAAGQ